MLLTPLFFPLFRWDRRAWVIIKPVLLDYWAFGLLSLLSLSGFYHLCYSYSRFSDLCCLLYFRLVVISIYGLTLWYGIWLCYYNVDYYYFSIYYYVRFAFILFQENRVWQISFQTLAPLPPYMGTIYPPPFKHPLYSIFLLGILAQVSGFWTQIILWSTLCCAAILCYDNVNLIHMRCCRTEQTYQNSFRRRIALLKTSSGIFIGLNPGLSKHSHFEPHKPWCCSVIDMGIDWTFLSPHQNCLDGTNMQGWSKWKLKS